MNNNNNNDLMNRHSNRALRDEEKANEFKVNNLTKASIESFTASIKGHIQADLEGKGKLDNSKKILKFMYLGKEEEVAFITLKTILSYMIHDKKDAIPLHAICKGIGKSIINSRSLKMLKEQHASLESYIEREYRKASESSRAKAKIRSAMNLIEKTYEDEMLDEGDTATILGARLISLLVNSIDLIEIIRLDNKRRTPEGRLYSEYSAGSYLIRFTYEAKLSLIDLEGYAEDIIKPIVLPLKQKPYKVSSLFNFEADLVGDGRPKSLIKMPRKRGHPREFKKVMEETDISPFMKAHALIEGTEWKINNEVVSVIKYIFENNLVDTTISRFKGEAWEFHPKLIGGLPRRYSVDSDQLLVKSSIGRTYINSKGRERFEEGESKSIRKYNKIKNDIIAFNEANMNQALSLKAQLKVCEEFKDDIIYFTYQYDSRGRIYPVQGSLNPQADSVGKAMLKFNDSRPLTESGHYWAKIHGANCYGLDKEEFEDRIKWTEDNLEDIKRVGISPLLYLDKWMSADDPFGYLAFCIEYSKVLKNPSAPFEIPISLDCTCSGLQIYAGLLRDREGALAVNVIGNKRSDVYGKVAEEANKMLYSGEYERMKEHTNANGETQSFDYKPIADSLKGKITRKETKRNTMTQPYSVTLKGMQNQLREIFTEYEDLGNRFWIGEVWQVSNLLSSVNQGAINRVVKGASRGQEFIKQITEEVGRRKNKGLIWTTPVGFRVYQKNVKSKSAVIDTWMFTPSRGNQRIRMSVFKKTLLLNKFSQKNSVAPNVIHSFDSALLLDTVMRCGLKGVRSFRLVHDDYGTHANDTEVLNSCLRESYVEMFSGDVLFEWAVEVMTNAGFSHEEMIEVFSRLDDPMINTLDLKEVLESKYIIS